MPTYMERKRLKELAEREAAGESFWVTTLPKEAIVKIGMEWDTQAGLYQRIKGDGNALGLRDIVRNKVMRDSGLTKAPKSAGELVAYNDTDLTLSYIEAIHETLVLAKGNTGLAQYFADQINEILAAHRAKYKFVPEDGEIIPLESEELHAAVVEPALALLYGKPGFADAHDAYMQALKEIADGEPADAITDAGTALQLTLQQRGCDGKSLGPLIKDARKKGFIAGHDEQLAAGIIKFMDWASADRSEKGDGHKSGTKLSEDAWLMVHIVGALIVRLAEESKR